jgi:hypothetical protein
VPESISTKRRSISADHAASTSGSDVGSNVAPYFIESAARQFSIADGLGCIFARGLVAFHGSVVRGGERCAGGLFADGCARSSDLRTAGTLPGTKFVVADLWQGRDCQQPGDITELARM